MKKIEKPKRVQQSDEELRVDVYNDAEMVALGIRVPPLAPIRPSSLPDGQERRKVFRSMTSS